MTEMNFKMGPLANIVETEIEPGAVYFAKDDNKQYGELYYDDSEGIRVKIAPRISSGNFSKDSILTLTKEDSTAIQVGVPAASTDSDGFVTTSDIQHFAGIKTFSAINIRKFNSIAETAWTLSAGETYDNANNFIENVSVIASNYTQYLITNPNLVGNNSILANCKSFFAELDTAINQDTTSSNGLILNGDRGILFFDSPNSQSPGVAIRNGTIFCTNLGNEKKPINTATMTTLLATNIGSAEKRINNIHTNNINFYHSNSAGKTSLIRDANNTNDYILYLPSSSGRLIFHPNATQIGSTNIPIFISSSGAATACGAINIAHGGTGTSVAPIQGGIIYGATTSSYASTAAGEVGQLLQSNKTNAPSWITSTIGSTSTPVYIKDGVLTSCDKNFDQYLPLAGGTLTGPVLFNDIIQFSTQSYGSSKPESGQVGQLYFVEDDGVLITTNYGYGDPTSGTDGYGINGALYFKILED